MRYLLLLSLLFGCTERIIRIDVEGRFKAGDRVVIIKIGDFYQDCTGIIVEKLIYYQELSQCIVDRCDALYGISKVECQGFESDQLIRIQDHNLKLIKE